MRIVLQAEQFATLVQGGVVTVTFYRIEQEIPVKSHVEIALADIGFDQMWKELKKAYELQRKEQYGH